MAEILVLLGSQDVIVRGQRTRVAGRPVAILAPDAAPDGLAFQTGNDADARAAIEATKAAIVICHADLVRVWPDSVTRTLIGVRNPRLAFARVVGARFMPPPHFSRHPSAAIDPTATLGADVHIGPYVIVNEQCEIGDGCILHGGVSLYPGTRIGRRVVVHAGAVIGANGFGFERDESGHLIPVPQLGTVEIGDDVEIGANACIDRGTLGATRIGRGTKIDDLAYIAHNAIVGADALVMAGTIICGSAEIGDRVELSPGVIVRDKRRVGAGARVGLGAVVVTDVPPGMIVAGVPARPFERAMLR